MNQSYLLLLFLGLSFSCSAEGNLFLGRYYNDPNDILVKNMVEYKVWDMTDSNSWVKKGKLFNISIDANVPVEYYYYTRENGKDWCVTDGSLQSAVKIFKKEDLCQLDADTIRDISWVLLHMTVNRASAQIIDKNYFEAYERFGKEDGAFSPSKSDVQLLQKLIGKDFDNPIVVHTDKSRGRWTARFFVLTGSGQIESWEFSGVNNEECFTVDTLNRKLLDFQIKPLPADG